jgi:RND family efflux transporter MFP subunit
MRKITCNRGGAAARAVGALGVIACLLAVAGCGHDVERNAHAEPGAAAPKVTVAEPIVSEVTEWSEHTGRAEAVDTVEIRARAAGHLQRVAFHEGDLVKKGDLLFVVDPRPAEAALTRARAELERSRIDLELGRRDTARAEHLFKTNVIAEREWDTQSTALLQLGARTHVAAAAVSTAELDLEYSFVRAPFAGRIGRILVTPGNLVGPSMASPLATLVSVDPLHVYVDVDETHALHLGRAGANGIARAGFADEVGYPHEATIDFLDNRVDPQSGTQKVRVVVRNEDGKLTPGLFARVRLPEGGARSAVLIEDRAVGTDQDRRYVLVVDKGGTAQYRAVKLGPLHEGLRIVREGVAPSDRVIVNGLQRVRPGAKVTADVVAMSKDGGVR